MTAQNLTLAEKCAKVFDAILKDFEAEFVGSPDPVHLDLHLAASQERLCAPFFAHYPHQKEKKPLHLVIAGHYFTYDKSRITKIVTDQGWANKNFGPLYKRKNEDSTRGPRQRADFPSGAFNQLLMIAYRKLFEERHTLNAWLLRTSEKYVEREEQTRFELRICEPEREREQIRCAHITPRFARSLITDPFLAEVQKLIFPYCEEFNRNAGASKRLELAGRLHRDLEENSEKLWRSRFGGLLDPGSVSPERFNQLDYIVDQVEREYDEFREIHERICTLLRLPMSSFFSDNFLSEVKRNVFVMLQSAVFYMRCYDGVGFYSVTTRKKRTPYGITTITSRPLSGKLGDELSSSEVDELSEVVEVLADRQFMAWGGALRKVGTKYRLPEQLLDDRNPSSFKEGEGKKLWEHLSQGKNIPSFALGALLQALEQAANCEIEHQFPRTAFVLSQSSYLESVGFINIIDHRSGRPESFLSLLAKSAQQEEALNEIARLYELARWESGRGILPFDVVEQIDWPSEAGARDENGIDFNGSRVKQYLTDKWGFPEPSEGFHLLDLDPSFIFPEVGIKCVQRLSQGKVGWFQEGSPPSGRLGLRAYLALSQEIRRFVAGVTNGSGDAALIADGRVCAAYRRKSWEFYDRAEAIGRILESTSGEKDFWATSKKQARVASKIIASESLQRGGVDIASPELVFLDYILEAAECLSHTYRKGAIFVITDLSSKEWKVERDRFFIPMIHADEYGVGALIDKTDHFVSLAQIDGCCVVSVEGEVLGYALKIAVNSRDALSEKANGSTRRKAQKRGLDEGRARRLRALQRALGQPGTRRWSAALLSRAGKFIVINVSSDGPVTLFYGGKPFTIFPSEKEERESKGL